MRIAIVAPNFPEYSILYAYWMATNCEVLVCVDASQMEGEFRGRDIRVGKIAQFEQVRFKTPLDLWKLIGLVRKFKPTVLHLQEATGPRRGFFNACLATLVKPFGLVVLTVHDPVPHQGRDAADAWQSSWVRGYARRLANIVVVHGKYCAQQYHSRRRPKHQRTVISEHGTILEPDVQVAPPSAPFSLYMFGRMEAYKGLEVLVTAAEMLSQEGVAFRLSIEGRGPDLDRLQPRFEKLPEVKIHNGYVLPKQIMASVQAADCVVLPYLSATQSGVLAAAYAGTRYVVASDTGGLADVVKHRENGILVPPADARALADVIRDLVADKDLQARLLEGARTTAVAKLNWKRIADELYEIFAGTVG